MKFLIMFGSMGLGLLLGLYPGLTKPKPLWWKITAIVLVTLSLFLSIYPRIAGEWKDIYFLKSGIYDELDIEIHTKPNSFIFVDSLNSFVGEVVTKEGDNSNSKILVPLKNLPEEFKGNDNLILKLKWNKELNMVEYIETDYVNPILTYPFVPSLSERIKILNLHVPQAWVSVIAYLFSMIFAIRYLKTKNHKDDMNAAAAASLGTLFAILATVTGMFWAKYNWGAYWNWDPRQSSIFILIMIYFAYFALRSAIDNDEKRARLSSVYSIIAFLTVPFLIFILPRMAKGLHPGSAGEGNAGPIVSQQQGFLDSTLSFGFGLALFAFIVLFFWLYNILIRYYYLKYKIDND